MILEYDQVNASQSQGKFGWGEWLTLPQIEFKTAEMGRGFWDFSIARQWKPVTRQFSSETVTTTSPFASFKCFNMQWRTV